MKSAKERAREMLALVDVPLTLRGEVLRKAEQALREHARDQRQLCADSVRNAFALPTNDPHALAMNAPAPGEGQ